MTWAVVRKFWYVLPLVGLLLLVLWQRNSLTDKTAKLDAANVQVTSLTSANKADQDAFAALRGARVDNDAIAAAIAAKLGDNRTIETNTRTIIERAARDDPATRDWASQPVPLSVRGALHASPAGTAPGR